MTHVLFVFYMLVIGDIAAPLDNMETKLDSLWCQGERGLTNSSTSIQCHLWWEAQKVIGKMINFPVLYLDSLLFLHLPVFLFQSETNPIDTSFLSQRIGKIWSKQLRKKKPRDRRTGWGKKEKLWMTAVELTHTLCLPIETKSRQYLQNLPQS